MMKKLFVLFTMLLPVLGHAKVGGLEQINAVKGPYFGSEDISWVDSALVVVHPGMIARHDYESPRQWTNEEQLDLIKDFDPDSIQCWFGIPFAKSDVARSRGIAVCGGMEYEYESGIHGFQYLETHIFNGNGIGVTEKGSHATQRVYQTKGMNHLAPKWHEVVNAGTQRCAVPGDSLFQDNIIHGIGHPYGQFDDWSNRFFIEYLKKNFSPEEIVEMGIEDLEKFHIRRLAGYLRKSYKNDHEKIIDDPIMHEFIRFHYIELAKKQINIINQAKAVRAKAGKAIPAYYGNISGMTHVRSYGFPLSEITDVVYQEHSEFAQPCHRGKDRMDAASTLVCKNGLAAGGYDKPVWVMLHDGYWENLYRRISISLVNAEALANGGISVLCMKREIPEGSFRDINRHHAQLASQNRVLFTDRDRVAKVGLIRSLPNEMWGYFSKFNLKRHHLKHFGAAGRLLEDNHILYEVAVLGHPDVYDDSHSTERLSRYDTLVLPYIDCVSDRHIDILSKWTRKGGKLVLWDKYGTKDEERILRDGNAFAKLVAKPGKGQIVMVSEEEIKTYRNMESGIGEKIAAKIKREKDPLLKTDVDEKVWFNYFVHGNGPMVSVAMINYDIEPINDKVHPTGEFKVSIKVDNPEVYKNAYFITDDYKTYGADVPERIELPFKREGGYLTVRVPPIDVFGVVAFASEGEYMARSNAAELRKWVDRVGIANRSRWQELDDSEREMLDEAKGLLAEIQGDAKVSDFAKIGGQCKVAAQKLESAVKQVTMDVARKKKDVELQNAWADSAHKFDFGTEEDVLYGWKPVTDPMVYLKDRGYGWTYAEKLASVKCTTGDSLHGDYVRSQNPREQLPGLSFHFPFVLPPEWAAKFRADIPNGEYIVTVICGDEDAHYAQNKPAITYVDAQGRPALYGDSIPMGFYENRSFRATVDQGYLELKFWGRNVGPLWQNNCEWLINGLIIQKTTEKLSPETTESLARSDLHSRAVVRAYSVIGPLDDKDCLGLDLDYLAEELDLSNEYEGQAGMVKWEPAPVVEGQAPTAHFSEIFFGSRDGEKGGHYSNFSPGIKPAVGLAATFVYVPKPMKAVLESSSTQMAIGYVNGEQVFRDEYIAGVFPNEDSVQINLKQGWNSIMLKTTCHWGDEWASWISLYTTDGIPLSEIAGVAITADREKK